MMLRLPFLSALLFLMCTMLAAQQPCGTDEVHRKKMHDPAYSLKYKNSNTAARKALAKKQNARIETDNAVYTIPVVFHIMHKGEQQGYGVNISDELIYATVKELNERFRKVPGSVGDGNSVDMQLQFALAVRDPQGNCSNGINRIDMSGYPNYMEHGVHAQGMNDSTLKSLSNWDSKYYCNIWVVSSLELYTGYSSLPHQHGEFGDGVVIWYKVLPDHTNGIMTHEMGHYVGLHHVFNGVSTSDCSQETDCSIEGDAVCDTPPQLEGAPCEPTLNPCVPGEYIAATNYMSYSCKYEFTQGQKERSRSLLHLFRATLLEENGNKALVSAGWPEADFIASTQGACLVPGSEIRMYDRTSCLPNTFLDTLGIHASFSWTMTDNAGINLTSTDRDPVFTIPSAGSYDVTLVVTTPQKTSFGTKRNFVTAYEALPLSPSCMVQTTEPVDYFSRADDIGIREVHLHNLHHTSGTSIEDAVMGITNSDGYGDFSCSHMAALEPFTYYTISVVLSEKSAEHVHVYIDFDNNGITNEDLVTFAYDIPAGSGTFALPPFMTPGFPVYNTRLRMRVVDAGSTEPYPEACDYSALLGQIHDYSVFFHNVPPVANNDSATILEDNVAIINVIGNDTDADGTIQGGSVDLDPDPANHFVPIKVTDQGTWRYSGGTSVSFTPQKDFNGTASVDYTIVDNRYVESRPASIKVTVLPVNDPPFFTKGPVQVTDEDAGKQLVTNWASSISPGPSDESAQELTFLVTDDNNALFSVQPSISPNGDLSYTPAPDAYGSAMISVVLQDNGGTADGGVDTYVKQSFSITVNPVNDPPVVVYFTGMTMPGLSLTGDFSTGDYDPDGSLSYKTMPTSGPEHGVITILPEGNFTYTPETSFVGTDVITLEACDDGIPPLCATKTLHIQVSPVTRLTTGTGFTTHSVYPNPSHGEFKLSVTSALRGSTVKVSDLFGRLVYQSEIVDEKVIDLSQHAKGIYLLMVEGKSGKLVTQLLLN